MKHSNYSLPSFLEGNIDVTNQETIIELGPGTFVMDYGLQLSNHDTIIKGSGLEQTILIINQNIDFDDDSIFEFLGHNGNGISVSISDLTIKTSVSLTEANLKATKLTSQESYLIKCYNLKSLMMRRVKIENQFVETTCIDIRRGFNLDIRECVFANYNRRWTGGGIWLRGDIENVFIEDNDFYKYGNDEVIALWSCNSYVGHNPAPVGDNNISKKNVNIRLNRFYCQDVNGSTNTGAIITESTNWDGCNQRFINFYTNQDTNVDNLDVQRDDPCCYNIDGIHFDNNEIFINAPLSHLITISFDKYTLYSDVTVRNNKISYGNWQLDGNYELVDFCIYYDKTNNAVDDSAFCDAPFFINGNTIICSDNVRNLRDNNAYQDNHMCLEFKGTTIVFDDNKIVCTRADYTSDEQTFANKGVELLHCSVKGGKVFFNRNHCEGLRRLGIFTNNNENGIKMIILEGCNNYLQGDTRMNYKNVTESHIYLHHNDYCSDYPVFFLGEFADTGDVVFECNHIYRDITRANYFTTKAHFYYTSFSNSANNIQSARFVCCLNDFENVLNSQMYIFIPSTVSIRHRRNIYSDLTD